MNYHDSLTAQKQERRRTKSQPGLVFATLLEPPPNGSLVVTWNMGLATRDKDPKFPGIQLHASPVGPSGPPRPPPQTTACSSSAQWALTEFPEFRLAHHSARELK